MRWRSRHRSTTREHGSDDAADESVDEGPGARGHVRNVDAPEDASEGDASASEALADDDRADVWLAAVAEAATEHRLTSPDGPGEPDSPTARPDEPRSDEPTAPPDEPDATARPDEPALAAAMRDVVRRALDEDLDVAGDLTSAATVPPDATGRARLVARADGVVAGLAAVAEVFDQLDPRVEVRMTARDGDRVERGHVVAEVAGPLRSILTGERTALNLLTHLSGVATVTAAYVEAVAGTACEVRDTRKTTPGLRRLEKAAVRAGGGVNHRVGLSDALLVKDNHVAAAGGVGPATRAAIAGALGRPVQVEVDSLDELEEAVAAGARDVLLDNFDVEQTQRAVERVRQLEAEHGRILLESSGGLDLDRVRGYAQAGVDRVAVGALTHSAPQLDLALDLDAEASAGRSS